MDRQLIAGVTLGVLLTATVGCMTDGSVEETEPFIEDTNDAPLYNTSTTTTSFPVDTGFGGTADVDPDHWLHITQLGNWSMSPPGGPYNNMTGGLTITEIVDVPEDTAAAPECEVIYTLVGQTYAPNDCAECDWTLIVEFTGTGNEGNCHDPDMPPSDTAPGDGWPMGYSSSLNKVMFDYYGTGVWIPWYNAVKVGDVINIDFSTSIAIEVEDEDE